MFVNLCYSISKFFLLYACIMMMIVVLVLFFFWFFWLKKKIQNRIVSVQNKTKKMIKIQMRIIIFVVVFLHRITLSFFFVVVVVVLNIAYILNESKKWHFVFKEVLDYITHTHTHIATRLNMKTVIFSTNKPILFLSKKKQNTYTNTTYNGTIHVV